MKMGGLFEGYGGLTAGVQAVFPDAELAWYSEIDKGALKILKHHHPDVPNVGDITKVKWAPDCPDCGRGMTVYRKRAEGDPYNEFAGQPFYWCAECEREWDVSIRHDDPEADRIPEPVDILTGGSPCQDLSHAGKRGGMTEGTRSNLWVAMREAIARLRPGLVIWENVRGAYSACADSEMGRCPRCVGDDPTGRHAPYLRALGRVLGDLSDLGYDTRWHGLRAADVGAPHGRFRVFVIASDSRRADWGRADTGRRDLGRWDDSPARRYEGATASLGSGGTLLPTPRATDGTKGGPNQRGSSGDLMLPSAVTLLPTPAVNDMGEGKTVEAWDEWTATMQAKHGNGNGHGKSLSIEAQRLLPTPTSMDTNASGGGYNGQTNVTLTDATVRQSEKWGIYAGAIARWEALTRPAPAPTQPSKKGTPQLAPAFSEWMMGLPAGHVTDVPGITRNEALKALGNGVCPQQAAEALRVMLSWEAVA